MTTQVVYRAFGPKQVRQLKEVYECARAVKAKYPESHLASKAAKRLIDAFEAELQNDGTVLDVCWLTEADPQGTA
ncbi:hypothetical protein [Mesorhizobium erdmanii]|uniref:Uncharacterized protein n=1 Tax=Mesorhizobium erdmanii TaxID=1777866 RepID=A0A6M7UPM3_9HYPH|nr:MULTISPECIES: hypothetical protein [Mesorhizobium]OBQ71297.1 hypothetical protein A8146_25930 [Mesorhizobium loti]QKC78806.1 hypothetical protein EB233_27635 [Mesorhizobium erdmanii]